MTFLRNRWLEKRLSEMKRSAIVVALIIVCSVVYCSAQSGRKSKAAPTPVPQQDDATDYSESKPRDQALILPPSLNNKSKKETPAGEKTQSLPAAETSSGDDDVLRVETNLVTVPVSVFERSGVYVSGLRRSDFKIFEDGKEQEITYFGDLEVPFSVVLLIDVSPSTSYKIKDIQNAALSFVNQLSEQDKVMVIEFDSGVHVLTDFTNDRQQLEKAIRRTSFGNGTSLYEAVKVALRKKLEKIDGRKAVVLFTDGVDTTSHGASFNSTVREAEEGNSTVFPIYYNTFLDEIGIGQGGVMSTTPTIGIPSGAIRAASEDYALGRAYLQALADETGGRMFRAEATTGGLSAAFEGMANELRSQYTLGYYPQEHASPGQRKQIRVRVNRPNVAVRARDSYVVGQNASATKAAK